MSAVVRTPKRQSFDVYGKHSWAVAFTRVLQTGWASYTLWRTYDVQFRYSTLIVDPPTPCHFDVLPQYFATRVALQIPELVLNVTALISTSFLAWRIVKGYSTSTIRRVMPPPGVMRLYKVCPPPNAFGRWANANRNVRQFFLINCMFTELSLFFTLTATALWLDQLVNSSIARLALHPQLYYAIAVFSIMVRSLLP